MKTTWRTWLAAGLLATTSVATSVAGAADAYPDHAISWIVPFTPGGITDSTSRVLADTIGKLIRQSVIVENRPGVGGSLATEQVSRMQPGDGYTVLYATSGTMAANLALYKSIKYDPLRDFAPVHGMFLSPLVLVVETGKPYRSVADIVAAAKKDPGSLNFGSAGPGTATHLTAELFQTRTGTKMTHVPYKGSAPALQDLMGGRLDLMFDYISVVGPQIKAGRLRALAVTSGQRVAALPDVPTLAEAGVKNAESSAWSAIVMPAKAPPDAVRRFSDVMAAALQDKVVVQQFVDNGSVPMTDMGPEQLRAFMADEMKKWAEVVKISGASLN